MIPAETLVSVLTRRARDGGNKPFAYFSEAGPMSARELLSLAGSIADVLAAHGIRRGSRVVTLAPTGPVLLATLSAAWQLGALVCPAEAFLAPEGFVRILDQFRPDLVLIDPAVDEGGERAARCAGAGHPVLSLADAAQWAPSAGPDSVVSADDGALCIFTSGSTGTPKGVVLSHRSLLLGARNIVDAKRIGAQDRVLCVLPLSHLNGLCTTFVTPLASGGTVVYLQGPFDPKKALQLIDTYQCTWFSAVPTQYAFLMKPTVEKSLWSLKSLRFCRSASARLPARLLAEFEAYYGVPIIETMGMTETAGQIFCNPMQPEERRPASVGRPIGWQVRILDEHGNPCPDDVVGEIRVKGPAMMLGYLDNPEETARAFEDGWLRSGDLGRHDSDGFYFITGRIKDIAIFSGVNISLRAIEAAVQEQGLIEEIACVGVEDYFFGEVVSAYALPRQIEGDLASLADSVGSRLRQLLPSAQALKEVRIVRTLPRSSVGKILKGRLDEAETLYSTYRPLSRDPKILVNQLLHIPLDEIHDGIGLGLVKQWDSLGHVALVLAIENLLGRHLTRREIVALTTFRGMAQVMNGTLPESGGDTTDILDGVGALDDNVASEAALREKSDLISLMVWNGLLPGDEQRDGISPAVGGPAGGKRVLSFSALTDALRKAGLQQGDTVLLHSDISALGLTEAGADRDAMLAFYLAAFREVLGTDGTLSTCTSFEDYGRYGTPFVREESPSRLGAFSEYIRTRPGAIRSLHPIVSVTSLGKDAEAISGGPHSDGFGYDSPWGRLHRRNAKLMTLGMGHYPEMGLTFLHYIEHLYGVPYQYTKIYPHPVLADGKPVPGPFTMSVRFLDYSITYDTGKFRELLVDAGAARRVAVGANSVFCTTCDLAVAHGIEQMSRNRYYFLKAAPTFRQGEIPMDGATGAIQYVYDRAEQSA